jgi:hypothetical protein
MQLVSQQMDLYGLGATINFSNLALTLLRIRLRSPDKSISRFLASKWCRFLVAKVKNTATRIV